VPPHPLRILRSLGRGREIVTVLLNYGFDDLVDRLHLRRYVQWGKKLLFWKRYEPEQRFNRAQRIRMALESLGATFIKFGQVMSTRADLIPADVLGELSKLREQVPPFPPEMALEILQAELEAPVEELFSEFDPNPMAAGSLGQVHRATHRDGTRLAVKIRRPDVVRQVERDLTLMIELATLIEKQIPELAIFDPVGLVNHFSRTIHRELNFSREGRTIEEFRRLFRNDATLYVPHVFNDLTSDAVLTMEFIDGCKIDDDEGLKAAGISSADLAANGSRIFMKMAFELGVFHGDPHPGNIRIMPDGAIALLDYGMIGVLDDVIREMLVDLFTSVARQDEKTATNVIRQIGQPFRPIDEPLLRADVRDFVETYYGISLERLHVGKMLSNFVSILSSHGIRCPGDLMLLIRAMITLEGVGRSLDPEFNMAEHLVPFIEKVVRDRYDPRSIVNRMMTESKTFLSLTHDLPLNVGKTIEKLSKDDLSLNLEHRGLEHLITELDRSSNRVVIGVVMSSLIISSALIFRTTPTTNALSVWMFVLWSLLGLWLIYGVFRSGRL
jgi:ubiquinone biosynthesis protein